MDLLCMEKQAYALLSEAMKSSPIECPHKYVACKFMRNEALVVHL